jgi:hypothetical protein
MARPFPRLLLVAVVAALSLGSCMTAAGQQEQPRQIAGSDDAACRTAGLKPGTPAYVKCRQDRENLRVSQIEADRAMQRMFWDMNQANTRQWMSRP